MRILITEFMDQTAVASLAGKFDVRHDAKLADRRGELLASHDTALVAALRAGHLGGAALDVFEHEPVPAGSPLAGVSNLVLTPHVAGVTRESNARVSSMIADKVAEALARR